MSRLKNMLEYNRGFVDNKEYEMYKTNKYPNKKIVILTCMDTRLIELLPKALNLQNGDAKIIKNAGAVVTHPFGSVMRSIIVAIYELKAEEIYVIGHDSCGMSGLNADQMIDSFLDRGISKDTIDTLMNSGIELKDWLKGFSSVEESVLETVDKVKKHPLIPGNVDVNGLIMDPITGAIRVA